ncbi:Phosphatidylcholine-sterol acyltransferase [Pseudocercospora fuligena]|uniref:Phosphatidylcholine-sterol acyltransferase n=1 Tax=Pseudocercospora fuligena TaxID=685502 RepID=A0A8H6VCR2_9PEZI|nr:Phosphatidylcholine-sterol acyltransferase [Pseudocercospora fuligena]
MLLNPAVVLSLLTCVDAFPARRQAGKYGRLIVFGDSFSDNGSGAWVVSNHTWPADPAYFNHSFSNGPVWAVTLSNTLGTQLLDYATGGATADNSFVPGFTGANSEIPVPSAYDQLKNFLANDKPKDNDLFVHWIGANDPLFNPGINGSQIVSLINRDVELLWRSGAKHVLIANYPPVSAFPAAYNQPVYQAIGPPYAAALDAGLVNIQAPWSAYMDIRFVNVEKLFQQIESNPSAYGIDAKYLRPPTPCLQGTYGGGENRTLCTDPQKHLFWDAYHPVTTVHNRIAKLFQHTLGA